MKVNPHVKYYKGVFTGVFYTREHSHLPFHHFHEIEWQQIHIDKLELLEYYDVWEMQTSNSWYRKMVKPYKNWFLSRQPVWNWPKIRPRKDFPWIRNIKWQWPTLRKRPHLVIPINDQYQLQETLHEVLIKKIELIDEGQEYFGGLRRAKGLLYFQIHLVPPKIKKAIIIDPLSPQIPIGQVENLATETPNDSGTTNIWDINQDLLKEAKVVSPIQQPLEMTSNGNRRWLWFILLWLLFCLWKLPALLVPSLLVFGAIAFYRYFRKACLGLFVSLLVMGMVIFLLFKLLPQNEGQKETVKTEDGSIKILPPKPTSDKDLSSIKKITWWDFIRNKFSLNYATSAIKFFETESAHKEKYAEISARSSVEFFQQLYGFMEGSDAPKIDSVVIKFRLLAEEKKLNTLQTTEMVCTFVQEVPYFLVHDFDCRKAVAESGSDFMAEYHSENKPCLPNIPGGVQSPYEFLHNLKGDCDTRSLLAYTILKEMGISASVWISETYGHSVLGVGLPVGSGFYKEVNGVKHYAIELTAKGFRLGMISPEQQIQGNWDIALFYNR